MNDLISFLHKSQKINFSILKEENPLQEFQKLANQFKTISNVGTAKKPWKVHIPLLGQLAETYLVLSELLPNLDKNRLIPFFQDINSAKSLEVTNYQWFLTFIDALSIANTHKNRWFSDKSNSTLFDEYRAEIIRQTTQKHPLIEPNVYRDIIRSIGNKITRKFATTWAVSKLFPTVVVLPYPYSLSDEDIVMSLPTPENALWLAGFPLGKEEKIEADGESMPRGKFFFHDILHFVIYRSGLSVCTGNEPFYHTARSFNYIQSIRSLFFDCVSVAQHMIKKTKKEAEDDLNFQESNERIHRLTALFSFLFLHETRLSAYRRLKAFVSFDFAQDFFLEKSEKKETIVKKSFFDSKYYASLLPSEWKKNDNLTLKNNFLEFHFIFSQKFKNAAQEIFLNKNLIQDIENLVPENDILFDPSIYHLFGTFEFEGNLSTAFWDKKTRPGIIRVENRSNLRSFFGNELGNQGFYFPESRFRYWYFHFMPLSKDKEYNDTPNLTEQFQSHQKKTLISAFDWSEKEINSPIDNHHNTKLIAAIASENEEETKKLIKRGACVNKANCFGETPLFWACIINNASILKVLLKHNADVTFINSKQETALHIAVKKGATECVNELRKYKICLEQKDWEGLTPIQRALSRKNKVVFEQLLSVESNVNQKSPKQGISVFMEAIYWFPDLALTILDSHHPDVSIITKDGYNALWIAYLRDNLDLFDALIRYGVDMYHPNPTGLFISHQAVSCGKKEIIQILASYNFNFHREVLVKEEAYGTDFLLTSSLFSFKKDFEIAEILLQKGLKSSLSLVHSIAMGNVDVLTLLLKYGHDFFVTSNEAPFCFFIAATNNQEKILDSFINQGFLIPMQDLDNCLNKNDISAFRLLLSYKPNINQFIDDSEETLLSRAVFSNQPLFIQLLIENGAHINFPLSGWKTPLQCAVFASNLDMIKLLLSLGANPNQPTNELHEPLLITAIESENEEIVRLLLEKGGHALIDQSRTKNLDHNALVKAACESTLSMFSLLLEYNIDLKMPRKVAFCLKNKLCETTENDCILSKFVFEQNVAGIKLCLENGITLDKEQATNLLNFAKNIKNQEIFDLLRLI